MTGSAKQSIRRHKGRMDCFVASLLAMTVFQLQTQFRDPAARYARAVDPSAPERGRRECRVRAAPAVSCASCTKRCAHEHTGSAETLRHSLRNGFTAYAALSPATNSSCHRRRRISDFAGPGRACENLRRLDTSNGCQDHTVLPYASAPFAWRAGDRSQAEAHPAIPCAPDAAASTASLPNVADDHDTPLLGAGTAEVILLICPSG
jgi:hypothetical protein